MIVDNSRIVLVVFRIFSYFFIPLHMFGSKQFLSFESRPGELL